MVGGAVAKKTADIELKNVNEPETKVNDQAETQENIDGAPKEPTTEEAPRSENGASEPVAEPEATSTYEPFSLGTS